MATLGELAAQSDALRGVQAALEEAEAHVEASERTLDDINAGCFGCFAPAKRLARRRNKGAAAGAPAAKDASPRARVGCFAAPAEPGGGDGAAAASRDGARAGPAPLRRGGSAKALVARARLPSSQPPPAAAGAARSGDHHSGGAGGGLFPDAALNREAAAQDATLGRIDAAVRDRAARAWRRAQCAPLQQRLMHAPRAGDGAAARVGAHRRGVVAAGARAPARASVTDARSTVDARIT